MKYRSIATILGLFCAFICNAAEVSQSVVQFNVKCPSQKLGLTIDNYYHECHSGMIKSQYNSCEKFIAVFKELMPEYDCARPIDMSGDKKYTVPAIWLLGDGQFSDYHALVHELVFNKIYSTHDYENAKKAAEELFYGEEFKKVLDASGEEYVDEWNAYDRNRGK